MAKREFTQGVTPKGSLLFPHIYEPETYEGKDVGFTVNIKFDQKETDAFIAVIDKELEKAKHSIKLKPGQKWSAEPFLGYREDKMEILSLSSKQILTAQQNLVRLIR